jgi:hypothetical protein
MCVYYQEKETKIKNEHMKQNINRDDIFVVRIAPQYRSSVFFVKSLL